MPLMHSESLEDQDLGVRCFSALAQDAAAAGADEATCRSYSGFASASDASPLPMTADRPAANILPLRSLPRSTAM